MSDPKEKFRKYSLRSVFGGILYIVKTSVQWRMLPLHIVYDYFSKWKNESLLEEIFDTLLGVVRRLYGGAESLSLGTIDSRSEMASQILMVKGYRLQQKEKGRNISWLILWGYPCQ